MEIERAATNPNAGSGDGGVKEKKKKNNNNNKGAGGGVKEEEKKNNDNKKGADGGKEGSFLLGDPTFYDLDGGRLRCVETGHELLARDKFSYSRSKTCRLALIDAALAAKKTPLNMFKPHPTSKSQLICKLTGDAVNKTEEHIWKHINGKRFLNKLEKMEMEKLTPTEQVQKDKKQSKKKSNPSIVSCEKDQKKTSDDKCLVSKSMNGDNSDLKEPDFWIPPVGSRWDFDDGTDRWTSCDNSDDEMDNGKHPVEQNEVDDSEKGEFANRTKRMEVAIGPSSFVSKKKRKRSLPPMMNEIYGFKGS